MGCGFSECGLNVTSENVVWAGCSFPECEAEFCFSESILG